MTIGRTPPFAVDDWISQGEGDAGRFARVLAIWWSYTAREWLADLVIFNGDGTVRNPSAVKVDLYDYFRIDEPPVPIAGWLM